MQTHELRCVVFNSTMVFAMHHYGTMLYKHVC